MNKVKRGNSGISEKLNDLEEKRFCESVEKEEKKVKVKANENKNEMK